MSVLLDVNVLMALAWPNHTHHRAARRWFDQHAPGGWATTPFTEAGFVRTSSNRAVLPTATTPSIALELLTRLSGLGVHEFWPDDVPSVVGAEIDLIAGLRGHRQVTDAHLLALAQSRGGRVATFDGGLVALDSAGIIDLLTS